METEQCALLVSIIALIASIGIPLYQWKYTQKVQRDSRRTLLLQRILETKSIVFTSTHELISHINQNGHRMDQDQKRSLEETVPRMRSHYDELEELHNVWSDYSGDETLADFENVQAQVDVAHSEAVDTAKLIENGKKSFEGS